MRKNRVSLISFKKRNPIAFIVMIHYFPNYLIEFFIFIYEFDPNLSRIEI
jgi:hypothetical protein